LTGIWTAEELRGQKMGNLKFKKQRTCPKPRLERGIYRADLQNAIILDSNVFEFIF
jgi:hypothetical protein